MQTLIAFGQEPLRNIQLESVPRVGDEILDRLGQNFLVKVVRWNYYDDELPVVLTERVLGPGCDHTLIDDGGGVGCMINPDGHLGLHKSGDFEWPTGFRDDLGGRHRIDTVNGS